MTEQSSSVTTSVPAVKLGALVAHCAGGKMLNDIEVEYAGRNTTIHPDALVVFAGDGELLERFARRPQRPALPRRDAPCEPVNLR